MQRVMSIYLFLLSLLLSSSHLCISVASLKLVQQQQQPSSSLLAAVLISRSGVYASACMDACLCTPEGGWGHHSSVCKRY